MPKCDKYHAKWKANIAKCSKYHAKCKVTMPKCSKYHAKRQVLVPNCCKYKANGTGKESKKTNPKPEAKKNKTWGKKIPKTILHPWPWQLRPSTSMRYFPAAGRCRCRCQDLANVWATWRSQCRELWANVFWESWGCRCQKRWWGRYPSETYLETSEGKKTCGFPGQIATWNPTFPIPALQQTPQKLSKNHLPSMAPSIKSPGFISADGRPLAPGRHLRDRGALPWGPAAGGGAARGLRGDGGGLRAVFSGEGGDLGTSTGRLGAGPGEHGF